MWKVDDEIGHQDAANADICSAGRAIDVGFCRSCDHDESVDGNADNQPRAAGDEKVEHGVAQPGVEHCVEIVVFNTGILTWKSVSEEEGDQQTAVNDG